MQMVLAQSQDKALRKLSELKEQLNLEQAAKRDVELNYMHREEEKNEAIKVLQLQVSSMHNYEDEHCIVIHFFGFIKG